MLDTSQLYAGGQVRVTITCVTNLSDLTMVGFPGHQTLTASAKAPLEQYRQVGLGFSNSEGRHMTNEAWVSLYEVAEVVSSRDGRAESSLTG